MREDPMPLRLRRRRPADELRSSSTGDDKRRWMAFELKMLQIVIVAGEV